MNVNVMLERGIGKIMKTAGRFYLNSARGRAFLSRCVPALQKSAGLRRQREEEGLHVPPFLIASISSRCNLHCAGCYARAGGACGDTAAEGLSAEGWRAVFAEACDLGVSFILLAGGEPLLRPDILEIAAGFPGMIFPVFTNGTLLDEDAAEFFDRNRNLVPVLSVEGDASQTDARRGDGTHARISRAMAALSRRHILWGVSVTVSRQNMGAVTAPSFAGDLRRDGCGLLLYVEYVPVEEGTEHLALEEADLPVMLGAVAALKQQMRDMIVLSFPGDEAAMGGCLASGRGFFHINPAGDAEPCPFAPCSRHNLQSSTIAEVLQSGFFGSLRDLAGQQAHTGGCTLFSRMDQVACLAGEKAIGECRTARIRMPDATAADSVNREHRR